MYHRHSASGISFVEFRHLGKRDELGRYRIHFHLRGDTMRGSSVVGASIWDSHNRWITIHGTDALVIRDCVGDKNLGHGYQDTRIMLFIRFEDNEAHTMRFFCLNLRGVTRPIGGGLTLYGQNETLAREAAERMPLQGHPFWIRNFRCWEANWAAQLGTTGVFVNGLDVFVRTLQSGDQSWTAPDFAA
jgi:hypothetical protein